MTSHFTLGSNGVFCISNGVTGIQYNRFQYLYRYTATILFFSAMANMSHELNPLKSELSSRYLSYVSMMLFWFVVSINI